MPSTLLNNIEAYWNLNDNGSGGVSLVDSTGNSNTLTNNGGVTLGTGIINGDAVFLGNYSQSIEQSLSCGSLFTPGTGNFSISLWANSTTNATTYPAVIGCEYTNFSIYFLDNIVPDGIRVACAGGSDISIPSVADYNLWYNIVFSRNAGDVSIYLNGNLVGTGTNNGFIDFTTPNPLYLGENSYGIDTCFNGQIDEVGIWSRSLTGSEVTELYNGGSGITYPFIAPSSARNVISIQRMLHLPNFVAIQDDQNNKGFSISKIINLPWFINL
jgi:hypothetical protein